MNDLFIIVILETLIHYIILGNYGLQHFFSGFNTDKFCLLLYYRSIQ